MLFKPGMCQAILDGTKTQTRRLVKYGDGKLNLGEQLWFMQGVGSNIGLIFQRGRYRTPTVVTRWRYSPYRIKWQVGRTYAIQPGRGKKAVGRFLLIAIRREKLQDISEDDCWYEGVRLGNVGLGGLSYQMHFQDLWDSIHTKPGTRWADNPEVWPLEFECVSTPKES